MKVHVVHSFDTSPEFELVPSAFVPSKTVYFMTEPNQVNHLKSLYQAEKERNEWIRKYENALNGLNYWRGKAMEK